MLLFLFCVCVCVCVCVCNKFLLKYKGEEKASDIGIRRGQKEYPLASVNNEVIYSKECLEVVRTSHNLHFKITELARGFYPETVLRQDTLLLYNPKECGERKKGCPFFLL